MAYDHVEQALVDKLNSLYDFLLREVTFDSEFNLHITWHMSSNVNMLTHIARGIKRFSPESIVAIHTPGLSSKDLQTVLSLLKPAHITLDVNAASLCNEFVDDLRDVIDKWVVSVDTTRCESAGCDSTLEQLVSKISLLKSKGQNVSVNIVLLEFGLINDIVSFLKNLDVDEITLSLAKDIGRGEYSGLSPLLEYERVFSTVKSLSEKYNVNVSGFTDPRIRKMHKSCYCGLSRITVDSKGFVYPCELMLFNGVQSNVNIMDVHSVKDLVDKLKYWSVYTLLVPPSCRDCKYKDNCNKGCRFITYLSSGIPIAKPVLCPIKKNTIYEVIGYRQYSPLFKEVKKIGEKLSSIVLDVVRKFDSIQELGAGAGRWVYHIEKMTGKPVLGYEVNPTMHALWTILKSKENLRSDILLKDAREAKSGGLHLMMDNFITHFSSKDFESLAKKAEAIVLELQEYGGDGEYTFYSNGRKIIEIDKSISKNKIVKKIYNGIAYAEMVQYIYDITDVVQLLETVGFKTRIHSSGRHHIIIAERFK